MSDPSAQVAVRWSWAALVMAVAAAVLAVPTPLWGVGLLLAVIAVTIALWVRQGLGHHDRRSAAALTVAGVALAAHFVLYGLALLA